MDPLPEPLVLDFDGPLGVYEAAFDRRRIAAAMDERGRVTLVRPHAIVIDVPEGTQRAVDKARKAIDADDEVVLMPETGAKPAGGVLGSADRRLRRKGRWEVADVRPPGAAHEVQ